MTRKTSSHGVAVEPDHHVAIIGAGLSGLGMAIRLLDSGVEDVVIFERAADLGGTWRDNTYPGIGVDVPAHAYQFSYALNPDWSRVYAKGDEILSYIQRLADTYKLRPLIQFGQQVGAQTWDEEARLWHLQVGNRTVTARFVIAATGLFATPKTPQIPGLDRYEGEILRSSSWNHGVDLTGKRVGIIGTGASAVQIIPEIASTVSQLDVYQRTPIWIAPKIDPRIPAPIKTMFRHAPPTEQAVRTALEFALQWMLVGGIVHYDRARPAAATLAAALRMLWYRMQVRDAETRAKLTPDYDLGCKRPAFSNKYLRAFDRPNVALITETIDSITKRGVRTSLGNTRDVDVLILATGFWLSTDPEAYVDSPVNGRAGFELGQHYWGQPRTYHGISIPSLPNYFTTWGHYGWTGGTWHELVEVASEHVTRVITEADRRGATVVEVRANAADAWTADAAQLHRTSLFNLADCATSNTYYVDRNGNSAFVRPETTRSAHRNAHTFPLDDYQFVTT